jgi:hypothetical protein
VAINGDEERETSEDAAVDVYKDLIRSLSHPNICSYVTARGNKYRSLARFETFFVTRERLVL